MHHFSKVLWWFGSIKFSISSIQPAEVPLSNKLKGDKTTIDGLLAAHYGEDWIKLPESAFYKIIKNGTVKTSKQSEDDQVVCQNENDTEII
nr:unnamed protein product [Callosobruchus chinensis]